MIYIIMIIFNIIITNGQPTLSLRLKQHYLEFQSWNNKMKPQATHLWQALIYFHPGDQTPPSRATLGASGTWWCRQRNFVNPLQRQGYASLHSSTPAEAPYCWRFPDRCCHGNSTQYRWVSPWVLLTERRWSAAGRSARWRHGGRRQN